MLIFTAIIILCTYLFLLKYDLFSPQLHCDMLYVMVLHGLVSLLEASLGQMSICGINELLNCNTKELMETSLHIHRHALKNIFWYCIRPKLDIVSESLLVEKSAPFFSSFLLNFMHQKTDESTPHSSLSSFLLGDSMWIWRWVDTGTNRRALHLFYSLATTLIMTQGKLNIWAM